MLCDAAKIYGGLVVDYTIMMVQCPRVWLIVFCDAKKCSADVFVQG